MSNDVATALQRWDSCPPDTPGAGYNRRFDPTVSRMIRFSCKCGFEFNLTDDRAGDMLQCPRCGLLVDAPRADELAWMGPDGTLAMADGDAPAPPVPGQTLAEMYRTYSRHTTDAHGVEKDLRPGADHFQRIGDVPDTQGPERIRPYYDPVTGERIVPLGLKDEAPKPVVTVEVMEIATDPFDAHYRPQAAAAPEPVPVMAIAEAVPVIPAKPLAYATGDAGRAVTLRSMAVDLLVRPANVIVLFFIWWFYVAAILLKIPLNTFALYLNFPPIVANLLNIPLWLLAAHYGCVVEETGPDVMDDLPRPLRNLDLADDLFGPGVRVAAAGLICFAPMLAVAAATGMDRPPAAAATLLLAVIGCMLFPAVVLTLLTGTTVLNLTPPRLIGVIVDCGLQYVVSTLLTGLTLGLTLWMVLGPSVLPVLAHLPGGHVSDRLYALVPGLAATVYVTHALAFHLGFLYRAHHHSFPWLAQRHIPKPKAVRVIATEPRPPRQGAAHGGHSRSKR
jgi:hypothetical protein